MSLRVLAAEALEAKDPAGTVESAMAASPTSNTRSPPSLSGGKTDGYYVPAMSTSGATAKLGKLNMSSSTTPPQIRQRETGGILNDISSVNLATNSYFTRLTSLPLAAILAEPANLAAEARMIATARSELAFAQYPSFLHAHAASTAATQSLDSLSHRLDSLSAERAESFLRAAGQFVESAQALAEVRRKLSCLSSQYNVLIDLLKLPQLAAACIRSNKYAEAMDLASHAKRLSLRYRDVEIIQRIAMETEKERARMLGALVRQLGEETKLPGALRVIGYLRRGGSLQEGERGLRMAFLKNRGTTLRRALEGLDASHIGSHPLSFAAAGEASHAAGDRATQALRRRIDLVREHLFDIVTQYRALFGDAGLSGGTYLTSNGYGVTSTLPNQSSSAAPGSPSTPRSTVLLSTPTDEATSMLVSHITYVLERQLLTPLREMLACVTDPSTLATLLTQTMYCGMSLGRAGIDFRKIVAGHFEVAALRISVTAIQTGVERFVQEVDAAVAVLPDVKRSTGMLAAVATGGPLRMSAQSEFSPPAHLVSYPAIARLCNAFLGAFNGLRSFAPIAILRDLIREVDAALARAHNVLVRWAELVEKMGMNAELPSALLPAILQAFTITLAPYVRRCLLEGVYGSVFKSVATGQSYGEGENPPED